VKGAFNSAASFSRARTLVTAAIANTIATTKMRVVPGPGNRIVPSTTFVPVPDVSEYQFNKK
jgi:hypothetical protein